VRAWPERRTLAISVVVVAFLAVQLLVPLVALFGPRPSRFAWQMYSALPRVPHAWTVAADGTEAPIDLGSFFAVQRAEIDYVAVLRAGLCDMVPAPAVKIQADASVEPELIPCR
jgi:hypothetical protein